MAEGEYIYITHPEVMLCFDCLEKCSNFLFKNPECYINIRTYYLTSDMQENIDTVNWKEDFYNIKNIPNFYNFYDIENFLDYDKKALCDDINDHYKTSYEKIPIQFSTLFAEAVQIFDSWVFGGILGFGG